MAPAAPASPVSHVSDTARWVAMYRAMESERPDALFHDPWARRLAGPEGEAILRSIPKGEAMAWPMIVRTQVMDEIIERTAGAGGVDTVLNLAAGFDMRPYRLALPASLCWIEVDLPDLLAAKQAALAGERPRCALEVIAADLSDDAARRALFARVGASASRVLVVTEGLLGYLPSERVARLAADLHGEPAFHAWLLDLASPEILKRLERIWGEALRRSPLIFGPAEGTAFFAPYGWREVEYRSTFEESLRLDRAMRFARLFAWLGRFYPRRTRERFRRMSGIVLFERA
jgi:methyltransferase (TIGR00027 family)